MKKMSEFLIINKSFFSSKAKRKYQLVSWFPDWHGFHFYKMTPQKSSYYLIYEWFLYLGFWEIRKWQSNPNRALKNYREWRVDNENQV